MALSKTMTISHRPESAIQAASSDLDLVLGNPNGKYTLFTPENAAFEAISDILEGLNPDQIRDLLIYHALAGSVPSDDVIPGLTGTLLAGQNVTISIENSGTILIEDMNMNKAEVIILDIVGVNGIIHAIDKVLIPTL